MAVSWFIWALSTVQEYMIFPSGQGIRHPGVAGEELSRKLLLITVFYWAEIQPVLAHSSIKTQGISLFPT